MTRTPHVVGKKRVEWRVVATSGKTHIGALDGVRAIAVLAVILYHAVPRAVPGGFLGVDVFFVLSGYLITGVLLRGMSADGRLHLGQFWMRRIRRLVPALVVMLVTVSAIVLALSDDLRVNLGRQLLGAVTYSSNWIAIAAGDNYFDRANPDIFMHLWSLAIEEQYYIVWPLLVALMVLVFSLRRRVASRVAMGAALASGVLMASLFAVGVDVTRLYYGTDTHIFGLLIGSALAFVSPAHSPRQLLRGRGHFSDVAGCAALVFLLLLVLTLPDQSQAAYQGGMFAASLATALMIVVASDPRSIVSRFLSLAPMAWVGKRSYALYLWHWPIVVMLTSVWTPGLRTHDGRVGIVLAVVALSVLCAAASYRWVERPILEHGFRGWWGQLRRRGGQYESDVRWGSRAQRVVAAMAALGLVLSIVSVATAPRESSLEADLAQQQAMLSRGNSADVPPRASRGGASPRAPRPSKPLAFSGKRIIAVGDSVMLASASALRDEYPGIKIDAQVSRQASDVFSALSSLAKAAPSRDIYIIGVGTNGLVRADDLGAAVDALGSSAHVVLVNVYADRSWESRSNRAIEKVASARSNVQVADWRSQAEAHPDQLYDDGIHPRPDGAVYYVKAVAAALAALGFP